MSDVNQINIMISRLMQNSVELEQNNKSLKEENNKIKNELNEINEKANKYDTIISQIENMKKEHNLLSNELNNKTIEIENLKKNNSECNIIKNKLDNIIKEYDEYKSKCDPEKLKELGNQLEKINQEKKNYENKIKSFEEQISQITEELTSEKNKKKNNEKRFEECKIEYEKDKEEMAKNISELEKKNNDKLNLINSKKEELNKLNETYLKTENVISSLKSQMELFEIEVKKAKMEAYEKVKIFQKQISKSNESNFSTSKIKELFAENSDLLYLKDSSLTYQNLLNNILNNFSNFAKNIFINIEGNYNNISTLNIFQEFLRDIYFLLYIRCSENKEEKEKDKKLNSNDFNDDIILNVSNEIFKNNIFYNNIKNDDIFLDSYIKKFDKLSYDKEFKIEINELIKKKIKNYQNIILNLIQSIVKKCSETINDGNIVIDGKIIYNFSISHKVCNITKGYLIINNKFFTPLTIETIINKIKFPNEPIYKIQFIGSFNKISENYIQKVLLSVYLYQADIVYFSFKNCQNLSKQILNYIIFIISNLSKLKILDLESNRLNNEQIKILSNGLKENKTITALILSNNKISSDGGFYLADALLENNSLTQLYLTKNNILNDGLKSILNVIIKKKKINILDISYNDFESSDFLIISEFLNENPIMKYLNLSGNEFDMKSAVNLGNFLSIPKNIKSLNLSNMNIIAEYTPFLFKSFHFEELYFDDNSIQEVGCILLCKAISENDILKKLSLKNTGINSIGISHLMKAIEKLKNIQEIHLENNDLDENVCNELCQLCKDKNYKIYISISNLKFDNVNDKFKGINNIVIE